MGRKANSNATGIGRLRGAAQAVARFFTRGRKAQGTAEVRADEVQPRPLANAAAAASAARTPRRQTNIPLDVLNQTYTPPATSSKASFRSDGADHQHDQEFARGTTESRWNDEDRYTNKSGDPRIGTHRRTYEPGEQREVSRD
jgi:hypothetical protein